MNKHSWVNQGHALLLLYKAHLSQNWLAFCSLYIYIYICWSCNDYYIYNGLILLASVRTIDNEYVLVMKPHHTFLLSEVIGETCGWLLLFLIHRILHLLSTSVNNTSWTPILRVDVSSIFIDLCSTYQLILREIMGNCTAVTTWGRNVYDSIPQLVTSRCPICIENVYDKTWLILVWAWSAITWDSTQKEILYL